MMNFSQEFRTLVAWRISQAIENKGVDNLALERLTGYTEGQVIGLRAGILEGFAIGMLQIFAKALNVSLEELTRPHEAWPQWKFANLVRSHRHKSNLRLFGLASRAGIPPSTLLEIEAGTMVPTADVHARLIAALGWQETYFQEMLT